jgi:prepilin-type N-terminal cleavage/methylation domain-containing protein
MISFKHKNKGFTLVEMIISVGIFTVMSAIILANYPEFRSRSALDNLTAQIATVYREAQIYGISVREEGEANFSTGYGVHIDRTVSDTDLIIFSDADKDFIFNEKFDSIVETFSLGGGERITKLCIPSCLDPKVQNEVDSLTTVFIRPNPDAYFSVRDTPDPSASSISIEVSNRSGSYLRNVEVFTTGQISVR